MQSVRAHYVSLVSILSIFSFNCGYNEVATNNGTSHEIECTDILDTNFVKYFSALSADEYNIIRESNCGYVITGNNPLLRKIDYSGNEIWSKDYSEVTGSRWALKKTSDGGFIIGGSQYIFKSDSLGELEWHRKLEYNYPHYVRDIIETTQGDFAAVGSVSGDPGSSPHYEKGQSFLVKLNMDGSPVSIKRYGRALCPNDILYGLVQADDGGFVVAGNIQHDGCSFEWYDDLYVIKTDYDGNGEWWLRLGGNYWDDARDIIKMPDGGYALAGRKGLSRWDINLFVLRITSEGTVLWEKNFGSSTMDWGNNVILSDDGQVLLIGGRNIPVPGQSHVQKTWAVDVATGQWLWSVEDSDSYGEANFNCCLENND